jgi:hypothetical protein
MGVPSGGGSRFPLQKWRAFRETVFAAFIVTEECGYIASR